MKAQAQGDGTSDASAEPMSKEDRDWLETVMKEGIVDYVERSNEILTTLRDRTSPCATEGPAALSEEDVDELLALTEELEDIVDQIDFAKSLVQIGGLATLLVLVDRKSLVPSPLVCAAFGILATVAQNNPFAQDAMLAHGALPLFVARLRDGSISEGAAEGDGTAGDTPQVQAKALHAVSCLIRGHAVAEAQFASPEVQGISILHQCLSSPDVKLRRKGTFLVFALVSSDTGQRPEAFLQELGPDLARQAEEEQDVDVRENTISCLLAFVRKGLRPPDVTEASERCRRRVSATQALQLVALTNDDAEGPSLENLQAELQLWENYAAELAALQ